MGTGDMPRQNEAGIKGIGGTFLSCLPAASASVSLPARFRVQQHVNERLGSTSVSFLQGCHLGPTGSPACISKTQSCLAEVLPDPANTCRFLPVAKRGPRRPPGRLLNPVSGEGKQPPLPGLLTPHMVPGARAPP